jgi:hypothetical protein
MTTTLDVLQISLVASKAAPGLARTLIVPWLRKWNYADMSDDVLLIATELMTNAATATPCGEIRLRLDREAGGVLLSVWDAADEMPQPRPCPELTLESLDVSEVGWDDNGGWGLSLVAGVATDHGCDRDPRGGKWAWALLSRA